MRISDWSSDVCSSDLAVVALRIEFGVVAGIAVGSDEQIADLRRTVAAGHARVQRPCRGRLPAQRSFRRNVEELALCGNARQARRCRARIRISRVEAGQLRVFAPESEHHLPLLVELQLFTQPTDGLELLGIAVPRYRSTRGVTLERQS